MCKVSIIIPAYNAEKYIQQTLLSISNQSYVNFECIVVDDGSKDNTVSVVRNFNDNRIKLIEQLNSGGPAKPRNVGLAAASGEYIFIFDSDDIMLPRKLEAYLSIFEENKKVDVIFSDFQVIDEHGNILVDSFLKDYCSFRKICTHKMDDLYELDMEKFKAEIIKANFIGTSSVAFKAAENKKLFNEELTSGDDILAWISLAKNKKFYLLDSRFHQYRKREGSISTRNVERLLINKIQVLNKMETYCPELSLSKEITAKKNEYFYSLGYLYREQKRYAEAIRSYRAVRNIGELPKVIMSLIKVFILKLKNSEVA